MITLAQAIHIRQYIEAQRDVLAKARDAAAFTIKISEKHMGPDTDIYIITTQLDEVTRDFIRINKMIMAANATNTLNFEDNEITIGEAIDLAKNLRRESRWFLDIAGKAGIVECETGATNPIRYLKESTFTKEEVQETGLHLARRSNALSLLINETNEKVCIDFDAEKYVA